MGLQQILFVVLSVVIVGIAVTVGISMFNYQAKNNNRNSIISDMHYIATEAAAFYRTPTTMGGGGGIWDKETLYTWIAIPKNRNGKYFVTPNGRIKLAVKKKGQKLLLTGFGKEIGYDEDNAIKARLILKGINANPKLVLMN